MKIVEKKTKDLKPYENNPRINDGAVEYVANSIEDFGFKVPIVVDKDNVIVAGHTRWKAAQLLELEKVPCIVADDLTEEQVKAFRLADNKVGELAEWDSEKLDLELLELEELNMIDFGFAPLDTTDAGDDEEPERREAPDSFDEMGELETEHKCPKCGYEW